MAKQTINKWLQHYDHLKASDRASGKNICDNAKDEICRLCGWSGRTFYRKMDNPLSLSIAEKTTVANVYNMPAHFLFPEMEFEKQS